MSLTLEIGLHTGNASEHLFQTLWSEKILKAATERKSLEIV